MEVERRMNSFVKRLTALCTGAIVGVFGGIIGLGGAEFRIPVLKDIFKIKTSSLVKINLLISLITLLVSMSGRVIAGKKIDVFSNITVILLMILGSILGAYIGTKMVNLIKENLLEIIVGIILLFIGGILLSETFFSFESNRIVIGLEVEILLTLGIGVIIGIVSSMLGVAGGELIIPALVLIFGINIKDAGSLSILISIPTVITGLIRYRKSKVYTAEIVKDIVTPMGIGSAIGAMIGGVLIVVVSTGIIKIFLSSILFITSLRLIFTGIKEYSLQIKNIEGVD